MMLLGMLAGCGVFGSGPEYDPTAKMTPAEIYAGAKDDMSAGRWSSAVKLLIKLESRYPFGVWAQQAQLDTAYCQYRDNERIQALVSIERFIRLYPTSAQLDYAFYLKGLINFNEDLSLLGGFGGQDLSERDQKASKEAFESFRELVTRFPDSPYAQDASQRMTYIVGSLAQYEVHVARYYYRRGAYLAAINRAQTAVADYREVPALEEALFIIYKSYDALGMASLRDDAKRVLLASYPESQLLKLGGRPNTDPWWKVW
jgi:outer membrane protein assembly factor BamD